MPPSRSALNDSHAPLNLRGEPRDPQKSCDQAADGSICECMCFSSTPLFWVYDQILLFIIVATGQLVQFGHGCFDLRCFRLVLKFVHFDRLFSLLLQKQMPILLDLVQWKFIVE